MIKLFVKLLTQNFEISTYKKIIEEQQKLIDEQEKFISDLEESLNAKSIDGAKPKISSSVCSCDNPEFISWVAFDWNKIETRPTEYGKYLICRKDGKIHWENWNGSGWAYNHNEIRFWAVIVPPCS